MRSSLRISAGLGLLLVLACLPLATAVRTMSAETDTKPATADAEPKPFQIPENEKPFWDSAQAFLDAYANRDAEAIGNLFTEDAEFFDEFGELTQGREEIVAMYQNVFDESPQATLEEIQLNRVRFVKDDVALEEGTVIAKDTPDGPHFTSRYVALHVKGDDGGWRINTLKDYPRQRAGRREQLAQLAWMLGEWVNQDSESVVHTECDWSEDGNYLLRRFSIQTYDGREMSGVQRIGWDPLQKKLRSWTFDSEGGFLTGIWTKNGNQWVLTNQGATAKGEPVTGTSVYTVIDSEMITWNYSELIVGDEVRGGGAPVTMVRQPPAPEEPEK